MTAAMVVRKTVSEAERRIVSLTVSENEAFFTVIFCYN